MVVKVGSIKKCLALAAAVIVLGTGCSGINATQSFSPLMFFLPGLAQNKPGTPPIVPLTKTAPPAQVVSNTDLAKVN